ncbi:beta-glucosidase family protein [Streptomyces lancefieldiae]|uniref:Glycoside hydrolase family 3 C-terminal domain-containing protein n=1 Tax=Streptomyces lancefieldiae TaxID=3075520 RepID=A0ABU3AWQ8_9ACTN|nr:glycoside hydrolase family 3 C-terminal domain-containing protein [Streptomyces sp. DSM 40712]MDT0614629.1 glycoside hydrolase family 3 C-terminal domain-containing protein [Streptomyces sp. DSM 40712]
MLFGTRRTGRRTRRTVGYALAALCVGGLLTAPSATGAPTADPGTPRVRGLVAKMTLDEKISFVHWTTGPVGGPTMTGIGYLPGVPRLGIPELRTADGPVGIRLLGGTATAMPTPVALASTFDEHLAEEYGTVLGREGRALGQDIVLGPMTNIIRVPHAGRNFETYSEDPLLSSRMAADEVRGIQNQGLMATVKHFAANNQEDQRETIDATVDEQTLQEVELPAFRSAVKAGAASVMCSYNSVNGTHACSNEYLLQDVLREQWDFRGWVLSDWLATHATSDITKGLDQELGVELTLGQPVPDSEYFSSALKRAIEDGSIPEATLDRSVIRIVGQMERFGLLDGKATERPQRDPEAGRRTARTIAENGGVLLRNEHQTLPLAGEKAADIAVIGNSAKHPKVTGNGSAHVIPDQATAPVDAIERRAGDKATVVYEPGEDLVGVPVPDSSLVPAFKGGKQLQPGGQGVFYTGRLTVPADGDYKIAFTALGGVANLQIAGQSAVLGTEAFGTVTTTMRLTRGTHEVTMNGWAFEQTPLSVELSWVTPEAARADFDRAVAAASKARTAIVFAQDDSAEGVDRTSLSLPGRQDELIAAVTKVNPRTIVVLNTGSSVLMPWLRDTAAVLEMWYPGQEGAEATASLLFGDTNPSGRLTQTFPATETGHPMAGDPHRYPGVDGKETYSEGLDVGYRWYDRTGVAPLFPFGYGLSYTTFAYSDLSVVRTARGLDATVTVRNTGDRAGRETVQVYLGAGPDTHAPQALRKLAGFGKVTLEPGEQRRVTVPVDEEQLRYWDTSAGTWRLGTGQRTVYVGPSAAKTSLTASVTVLPR